MRTRPSAEPAFPQETAGRGAPWNRERGTGTSAWSYSRQFRICERRTVPRLMRIQRRSCSRSDTGTGYSCKRATARFQFYFNRVSPDGITFMGEGVYDMNRNGDPWWQGLFPGAAESESPLVEVIMPFGRGPSSGSQNSGAASNV